MAVDERALATRPSRDTVWLPWLDGWRGVSILFVLVGHFTSFGWMGHLGVEMFFVLSGRLMAEMLIVRRQPLGTFVWRRIARVWPALWTYVLLVGAALGVSWWFGDDRHVLAGALAALTFTTNYAAGAVSMPYFDHSWSLSVEEHCYLLLALIAVATGRRRRRAAAVAFVLALAAIASGAWQTKVWGGDAWFVYYQTDARAGSVLLPFALYLTWDGRRAWRWLALAALLPGMLLSAGEPETWRYAAALAALAVAVVTLDALPVRRWLASAPLRRVGLASFSLYLWQQPFMLLHRAGQPALLCVAGAVAMGVWSYRRVECPARARLVADGPRRTLARLRSAVRSRSWRQARI